jgi:hypothetical protein
VPRREKIMGGPWRERSTDKNSAPLVALRPQVLVRKDVAASDGVSAAVVGFVVALVTSLGVSIAFVAYLH